MTTDQPTHEQPPTAERWPVDYDSLKKGDSIPPRVVCEYFKTSQSSRHYSLFAMRLGEMIERELEARGLHVLTCTKNDFVHILTDEEAAESVEVNFNRCFSRARKIHAKARTIDRAQLDAAQNARLDRALMIQGAKLLAARDAEVRAIEEAKIEEQKKLGN